MASSSSQARNEGPSPAETGEEHGQGVDGGLGCVGGEEGDGGRRTGYTTAETTA